MGTAESRAPYFAGGFQKNGYYCRCSETPARVMKSDISSTGGIQPTVGFRFSGKSARCVPAFTLIELLVIIAIIAILAALLLPVLARAKSQALSAACLNNVKQLEVCWHLYALDNRDILVPNNSVYSINSWTPMDTGASWCPGDTRTDDNFTNIENGMLFPYNRSLAIYHCPADKSTIESETGQPLPQLRTRSYNLSQSINGYAEYNTNVYGDIPCFKKYTEIRNPDLPQCITFLDVHEDEIVDAEFGIPTQAYWGNADQWWDIPANRHNQGCNLSFADGHAEHWRWKVPKVYLGWLPQNVGPDEMPDYLRVQAGIRQTFN
jgi:prepilin-type processing-associated H-X9-DG protein